MKNNQDAIEIVEAFSDYIAFIHNGISYDVVPTYGDDLRRQIHSELSDAAMTMTHHIGDVGYEYVVEREYLYDHPDLIRLWLRKNRDLWIEVTED